MNYAHPILTGEEAFAWEKHLLAGKEAAWAAMNQAGRSLGRAALDDFREVAGVHTRVGQRPRVLVLVGKGHNGGDALLAADEILRLRPEAEVSILPLCDKVECRSLTRRAWDSLEKTGRAHVVSVIKLASNGYDLCLDGLLGMQFQPPLRDNAAQLLAAVNAHGGIRFRVAVDLPSGLGGEGAFRADFTYATGIVKAPAIDPAHAGCVGRLRYLDIGFFQELYAGPQASGEDALTVGALDPLRGWRPADADKRTFGHLFILAGSRGMPGALLMNAKAAARSGAGLVTAFAPESVAAQLAAHAPEVMWTPWPETPDGGLALEGWHLLRERLPRATALLMGSGLGREPETLKLVEEMVAEVSLPMVLDADALFPAVLDVAAQRGPHHGSVVITPHAGEFQRLAGTESARYDRETLTWFAHKHNVIVARKGPLTRVTDGRLVHAAPFGGPVLSRGGSGDLLAGLIGGLLAQWPEDALRAADAGVVWHGLAADLLARERGAVAVATTDLLDFLSPVLCLG